MTFRFDSSAVNSSDLHCWPPMRVYNAERGTQWLSVADLVFLKGEENYTWLHWTNGQRVLVSYTLKRVEAKLPSTWFIRLHRHYMVNRQFIDRIEFTPAGVFVHLATGQALPISRRRWSCIRKELTLRQIGNVRA